MIIKPKVRALITVFLPIVILVGMAGFGVLNGALPVSDPMGVYLRPQAGSRIYKRNAVGGFKEIGAELGVVHRHEIYEPTAEIQHMFPYHANSAAVAAADFDRDGYVDLMFTTMKFGQRNFLYRNVSGKKFVDATDASGLGQDLNQPGVATAVLFVDVDNDGWQDLYVARIGCHSFYKNVQGHFVNVSDEYGVSKICAHSVGAHSVDYDRDGFADIYISNFSAGHPLEAESEFRPISGTSNNNDSGGPNILLRNLGGKNFADQSVASGLNDPGYTWASGFTYINGDWWPDLYVADDFGKDQVYINRGDGTFENITDSAFTPPVRSKGSMTVVVGDIRNSGHPTIYTTNVTRPGLRTGLNYLLNIDPVDGSAEVTNTAGQQKPVFPVRGNLVRGMRGAAACGWGWGAQYLDFNLDGYLDLFVVNGFWNDGPRPYWYTWNTWMSLPAFLRLNPANQPKVRGSNFATNQRNCLFLNVNGKRMYDIGPEAGIDDLDDGRGVSIVDYDNDGLADIAIANFMGPPRIYHNELKTDNAWVGFHLVGTKSNRDAIGARVVLRTAGQLQSREIFPANGLQNQNDARIIFGLKNAENIKATSLEIDWPSGARQIINNIPVGQYTTVTESDAR